MSTYINRYIRRLSIKILSLKYRKPEINTRLCNDGSLNYQSNAINNPKIRFDGLETDGDLIYFHEAINDYK